MFQTALICAKIPEGQNVHAFWGEEHKEDERAWNNN